MSSQQQDHSDHPQQPAYQAPPKKKHLMRWVFGLGTVLLLIIVIVAVTSSSDDGNTTEPPAEGQPAEAPVTESAEPAEPATITSGVYEVGVDVQPGQYKTPGPPEDDLLGACYWARLKDDSGNLESIISNGNLEGPGTVTINSGEYFEANG